MREHLLKKLVLFAAVFGAVLVSNAALAQQNEQDVDVLVTSDNAYAFAFGRYTGISQGNLYGEVWNSSAGDITGCGGAVGPEEYQIIKADEDTYLYIIAWSDDSVYQGTMAQFNLLRDGDVITSGDEDWEVFATGINYSSGTGPSLESINEQIALANAAAGDPATSSVTWVDSDGEPDGIGAWAATDMSHLNICDQRMPRSAQWMWYDLDPTDNLNPFIFQSVEYHREYLIFRIPVNFRPLDVDVIPSCDETGASLDVVVRSDGAIIDSVWYEYLGEEFTLCDGDCGADFETTISGIFPGTGVVSVFATSSDPSVYDDSDTQSWECTIDPPACTAENSVEMGTQNQFQVVSDCACVMISEASTPAWANNIALQPRSSDTAYPLSLDWESGAEGGSASLDYIWQRLPLSVDNESDTYVKLQGDCSGTIDITWWPEG